MIPDNQPDPILDRTLAALRDAAPPEGMEARVLQTLASRETAAPSHWRALPPQTAWLRGALTGALIATAACVALFFILHTHQPSTPQTGALMHASPTAAPVALRTSDQCPGAPSIRDEPALSEAGGPSRTGHGADGWDEKSSARVPHSPHLSHDAWEEQRPHLLPASFAPSHPAPPAPLTAQERALVELARTATPAQLAALHRASDNAKQSEAEREAAFQKFFAPSPEIVAAEKAQDEALGTTTTPPPPPTEVQN